MQLDRIWLQFLATGRIVGGMDGMEVEKSVESGELYWVTWNRYFRSANPDYARRQYERRDFEVISASYEPGLRVELLCRVHLIPPESQARRIDGEPEEL